jgi:hypothetical protein
LRASSTSALKLLGKLPDVFSAVNREGNGLIGRHMLCKRITELRRCLLPMLLCFPQCNRARACRNNTVCNDCWNQKRNRTESRHRCQLSPSYRPGTILHRPLQPVFDLTGLSEENKCSVLKLKSNFHSGHLSY